MSFKLDFSEATDFGPVPDGIYEVVTFNVNEDATQNGAEFINFDFIIRNDIQQARGNSHLFHRIWKSKKDGKYNKGMVMTVAKACGLEDGKEYNSFDDFLADFAMTPVKVQVKNEQSEYNGKTYDNTNIKRFMGTSYPDVQHQFKGKAAESTPNFDRDLGQSSIDISDEDVPF